jgi:hypothetical protein
VGSGLAAKEQETKAWKVKYNIQTQQEKELQRAQQAEQQKLGSPQASQGLLA